MPADRTNGCTYVSSVQTEEEKPDPKRDDASHLNHAVRRRQNAQDVQIVAGEGAGGQLSLRPAQSDHLERWHYRH